jgi:hypothetical protein
MIVRAGPEQARQILGAMRQVASGAGSAALSSADRAALEGAYSHVFEGAGGLDVDALPGIDPQALAEALPDPELAHHALQFMAVMALVDGRIDGRKIAVVLDYARALGIHEAYLRQLAEAARGHLEWVAVDMMRRNVHSIPGLAWNPTDVTGIFLPYTGVGADAELTRRYQDLGCLPLGTFGRTFWAHYRKNGYALPGEKNGLNEKFATPHDSTHVLSGYDTSPHGELLVSTFTAAMHKQEPMTGHILPVIFSWHLGIKLNDVAKSATGAFDPAAFWVAWDRGSRIGVDLFGAGWDFWSAASEPLVDLRRHCGIPPLPAAEDATLRLIGG